MEKIKDRLNDSIANAIVKEAKGAARKTWRYIKVTGRERNWRLIKVNIPPMHSISILATILLLLVVSPLEHHHGSAPNVLTNETKTITYQKSGGPATPLDTCKWMRNGMVDAGSMMKQLLQNSCGDSRPYMIYSTPAGRTADFRLPDGSIIRLNAASSVRIPCDYGKKSRVIELLEGECFFIIIPSELVFTVRTADGDVTVLGTSFNISNYGDNDYSQISVASGKVLVTTNDIRNEEYKVCLLPDMCAIISRPSGKMAVEKFDRNVAFAWLEGKYISNGKTLEEICRAAERMYNVQITIDNPAIRNMPLHLTFWRENSVDAFLEQLRKCSNDSIYFYREGKSNFYIK